MSAQKEIIISGVGGQGLIACGTMIAEAAAIHDHKRATLSSGSKRAAPSPSRTSSSATRKFTSPT